MFSHNKKHIFIEQAGVQNKKETIFKLNCYTSYDSSLTTEDDNWWRNNCTTNNYNDRSAEIDIKNVRDESPRLNLEPKFDEPENECMIGTGKGSISCTIYTEFLNTIKMILKQFKFIADFINIIKAAIKEAINSILFLVDNITDWVTDAFTQNIQNIFDALKFLKRLVIPDNWGFNLGEFLICSLSVFAK